MAARSRGFGLLCAFGVGFLVLSARSSLGAEPELVKAFAFGSRSLTCASLTEPGVTYTMVVQGTPEELVYDAARGWGYEDTYLPDSLPYGDRNGYGVFGPFDDTANPRTAFPDTCPEELFDSFIGAKNFLTACNETTAGDRESPCSPPEGIIFRADVPNGRYRFVAAVGSADNLHAHRLVAEDGGVGTPANLGARHVVLVSNHDQAEDGPGVFAWVGFGGFSKPTLNGPAFVNMDAAGKATAGAADSPTLEVTQGYIRVHQLQGNSNNGAAGVGDPNGGDLVLIELWKIADLGPDVTPPSVASVSPIPGSTLRSLMSISVTFDEPVAGVSAADLLVAGAAAASVNGTGRGPYNFTFNQPNPGTVNVGWAAGHGITDLADPPNAFAGGSWTYTLDPSGPLADVVINEIMASNGTTLEDENGLTPDWIELRNRGTASVNLLGWSLSDDPLVPDKWRFPDVSIGAGQHLVVFASGEDRKPTNGANLHTNFQLDRGGDYLALYDQALEVAMELAPQYPEQRRDYSYGLDAADELVYFLVPTPRAANSAQTAIGLVEDPDFTPEHGAYDAPVDVAITTVTPGATLYYRIDPAGQPLTLANGTAYSGTPISVAGAVGNAVKTVQAMAVKENHIPSNVVTSSYVFPEQVVRQPSNPAGGWPATWYNPSENSSIPADYVMDQTVINNAAKGYHDMAVAALKEVPSVVVSMSVDDLFGAKGIYANATEDCPIGQGADCIWEKPCSAEIIYPGGRKGAQINCGIRMQGGSSRHSVWKTPKLSFRLVFRDDYGPTKLGFPLFPDSRVMSFNTIVLDAKLNMVWNHSDAAQHDHAQYVRELFCDDVQNAMGSYAAHDIVVNLYLNGVLWGMYNAHERPDQNFAADYLGGTEEEYDVLKHRTSNIVNPDPPNQGRATQAWNTMYAFLSTTPVTNSRYVSVQAHLDVTDLCDYMIMNLYVGNSDWAHQNWYATHRTNGGQWRFHSWDAEHVLKIAEVSRNVIDLNNQGPKDLFHKLETNAEWSLLFADRVHRHFFNGGVLYVNPASPNWDSDNPQNNRPAERYMKWIAEYDRIIVVESARWGDSKHTPAKTRDDWLTELNGLLTQYFPFRSANVLQQFKTIGLYPSVGAPVFSKHGGTVSAGFSLGMSIPAGTTGTIYFTTDGSDPRTFGTGEVSSQAIAYAAPIAIGATTTVKARIRQGTSWSALTEALFTVPGPFDSLRVTEIMYHPPPNGAIDGSEFEFVEIKNIGSIAMDLTRVAFTEGLHYSFPEGTVLGAGSYLVLVSSQPSFHARYPTVQVGGVYQGRLDNDRDTVTLKDPDGGTILSFKYADAGWWPREADGEGRSLVPRQLATTEDLSHPDSWRASANLLGSPGADDGASMPTPPQIIAEPADVSADVNQTAMFSVTAIGFPDPSYRWQKDGVDIPGAGGSSYTTPPIAPGDHGSRFRCIIQNSAGTATSREAFLSVSSAARRFMRGDANASGVIDISDAVAVLRILFASGVTATCEDAVDANDDGSMNVADAVYLLAYLFASGPQPPAPFGTCGYDAPGDALDCEAFAACP